MSFNKSKHLENVLNSHKMSHVDVIMEKYKTKRDEIKDALEDKFKDAIVVRAINSGSYAKHDAINIKFDLDICQPFKRNSFESLEEMADAVFNFFNEEYEDDELIKYKTRKQRVSTGLIFVIDGDEIQMDVVPGRELNEDDYLITNRLNLYVRPKLMQAASSTQTNIQKHIDLITGKNDERNIIRLLKIWKVNKNKDRVKSFLVELITLRAFDGCSSIPADQWEKLKLTLEFIRDNIKTIRLEDPANSNNVVSNTMTDSEKSNFSDDMEFMLNHIEENAENLKIYFSVNDEFYTSDEEEERQAAAAEMARSGIIQKPWCNY